MQENGSGSFFEFLPECVEKALYYKNCDAKRLQKISDLAEDQQALRDILPKLGLCAFVANGSILPRESGVSARPMKAQFVSGLQRRWKWKLRCRTEV